MYMYMYVHVHVYVHVHTVILLISQVQIAGIFRYCQVLSVCDQPIDADSFFAGEVSINASFIKAKCN